MDDLGREDMEGWKGKKRVVVGDKVDYFGEKKVSEKRVNSDNKELG